MVNGSKFRGILKKILMDCVRHDMCIKGVNIEIAADGVA